MISECSHAVDHIRHQHINAHKYLYIDIYTYIHVSESSSNHGNIQRNDEESEL